MDEYDIAKLKYCIAFVLLVSNPQGLYYDVFLKTLEQRISTFNVTALVRKYLETLPLQIPKWNGFVLLQADYFKSNDNNIIIKIISGEFVFVYSDIVNFVDFANTLTYNTFQFLSTGPDFIWIVGGCEHNISYKKLIETLGDQLLLIKYHNDIIKMCNLKKKYKELPDTFKIFPFTGLLLKGNFEFNKALLALHHLNYCTNMAAISDILLTTLFNYKVLVIFNYSEHIEV